MSVRLVVSAACCGSGRCSPNTTRVQGQDIRAGVRRAYALECGTTKSFQHEHVPNVSSDPRHATEIMHPVNHGY